MWEILLPVKFSSGSVLRDMEDFQVLVGVLASGLIAVNLYVIKSLSNLCDRISHLEGKLSRK